MNTLGACLFLLLDASGSVDAQEHRLQREATAAALSSPEVLARIEHEGGVALMAAEFSDTVTVVVDWTVVRDVASALVFAEALRSAPRTQDNSTSAGDAIVMAAESFQRAPSCERRVIDVSTDGRSNVGLTVEEGVAVASARGVQVNALVIEDGTEPGLLEYYRDAVNGFALPATWETYEQSIKMKMTLEIASYAPRFYEPERPTVGYVGAYLVRERHAWSGHSAHSYATSLVEVQPEPLPRRFDDGGVRCGFRPSCADEVPAPGLAWLLAAGLGFVALARRKP